MKIKPYYEELNIKIYCGDCLEIIKNIPNNGIDLIFTDPPYSRKCLYLYNELGQKSKRILKNGGLLFVYMSEYYFDKCFNAILKYLNYFSLFHIKLTAGSCNRLFPRKILMSAKTLVAFSKNKPLKIRWCFNFIDSPKEKTKHPLNWQQSYKDANYIIDYYSEKNDIILDPFLGSGTTLIACKKLNRKGIGIEINPEYCKIAEQRIKNTTS